MSHHDLRVSFFLIPVIWAVMTILSVFAGCHEAYGQATPTDTPTNTYTPTVTATRTFTPTPTNTLLPRTPQMTPVPIAFPRGIGFQIMRDMVCPGVLTAPCYSAGVPVTAGHKSLELEILGLASVNVLCRIAAKPDVDRGPVEVLVTKTSTAPVEFDRWCDELSVRITQCIACQVSAWVRAG